MFPPLRSLKPEDWYLAFFALLLLQVCALCTGIEIAAQIQKHQANIESYLSDWEVVGP
jgi:hypothetical protein